MLIADEARRITKYAQHEPILNDIQTSIHGRACIGENSLTYIFPQRYEVSYIINYLEILGGFKCRVVNNGCIEIRW
jgi:hypothetical protein